MFLQQKKILIFLSVTGSLIYTKLHIRNGILPVQISAQPSHSQIHLVLTAGKDGLQICCDLFYARSGVNQMRILKMPEELLENVKSLFEVDSSKTFDCSALNTTIPHDKSNLN